MFGIKKKVVYEISVEGMCCKHCSAKVEKALMLMDGVCDVKIDLEEKVVKVRADAEFSQQAVSEIENTINSLGYKYVGIRKV